MFLVSRIARNTVTATRVRTMAKAMVTKAAVQGHQRSPYDYAESDQRSIPGF